MNMYSKYGLFIHNKWVSAKSGKTIDVIDPGNEEILGNIPDAGEEDLSLALESTAEGFRIWSGVSGWERSGILRKIADGIRSKAEEIAVSMTKESGKPLAESKGEIGATADQFDWYADEARRIYGHTLDGRSADTKLHVRYNPVGPVAAFTAWNFPGLLPARKIAASIAAGCSVLVKPSEEAPSTVYFIAEEARKAGLPPGVINVVTGDPAFVSNTLINSRVIRKVSFTGSVPIGKLLSRLSADSLKKVSLELGGHAPVIVFDDFDAAEAGMACAKTKFRNCGQVCISPTRFYVHENVYETFIRSMVETTKAIRLGYGLNEGVDCGPMVNSRGRERVNRLIDDAVKKGAEVLCGGSVPPEYKKGYFFSPTVLGKVSADSLILKEEPFGPVAPVIPFSGFDEVIRLANDTPFGLAGYVFSRSLKTATLAAEALEVGMVGVNDLLLAAAEIPFGGTKESGNGREGGKLGILEYLEPKYIKYKLI